MKNSGDFYSEFGYYIHQIVTLTDKRGDELFRTHLGLSLRQFMVLRLVETDLPSQQLLADRLGIAKSAVSRHIAIAQKQGWLEVTTQACSRRQNAVILTAEGKRLLAKAKKLIEESELQGFEGVPTADVEATMRTLATLYQRLSTPKS